MAQTVAPFAEDSVLARLVAVDRDQFASRYWGQEPLLSPAADLPGGLPNCSMRTRSTSSCRARSADAIPRVAKNGTTLADKAFTAPGGVGAGIADQVSDDRLVSCLPTARRWCCKPCIVSGRRF